MSANDRQVAGSHYAKPIQHWDFVLSNNIPYMEAQVIRYLVRWREKNGLEDLEKARHYLEKLIEWERQHSPGGKCGEPNKPDIAGKTPEPKTLSEESRDRWLKRLGITMKDVRVVKVMPDDFVPPAGCSRCGGKGWVNLGYPLGKRACVCGHSLRDVTPFERMAEELSRVLVRNPPPSPQEEVARWLDKELRIGDPNNGNGWGTTRGDTE